MQDRHEAARGLYDQARELYVRAGVLTGEAECLSGLAESAEATGERDTACRLYAKAEALFRKTPRTDWVQWIGAKRRALRCPEG